MLYGQVKVIDQLWKLGININQALREFVRVAGDVANALNTRNVGHIFKQCGEISNLSRSTHRAAIGIDVLSQQRHFFNALVCKTSHFNQHVFEGAGYFLAARVRNHTIAAVFGAAFHDADKGACAFNPCRRQMVKLFNFRKADVYLRFTQTDALCQQVRQTVQRLWTKHHIDIRCPLNNGSAFLTGNAATHANQHAFFLQMLDAAQVTENFFLRFFAH